MRLIGLIKKCSLLLVVVLLFTMTNLAVVTAEPANENIENNNGETGVNNGNNGNSDTEGEDGEQGEQGVIPSEIDFNVDTDGGFEKVASTKYLDLYFDKTEIAIRVDVKDNEGNVIKKWRSQLSPKNFRNLNNINQYDIESMSFLKLRYINLNKLDAKPVWTTLYEEMKNNNVEMLDYKNTGAGISFILFFRDLNIKIPVVIEIVEDQMNVRIPREGFFENAKAVEDVKRARNVIQDALNELQSLADKLKKDIKKTEKQGNSLEQMRKKVTYERLNKLYEDVNRFSDSIVTESYSDVSINTLNSLIADLIKNMPEAYKDQGQRINELMDICTEQFNYLKDNISYGILELNVMPYFGYGTRDTDGYVFYPDGSGAISYFNVRHPNNAGRYEKPIYYNHSMNITELNMLSNYAHFPVWGVKQNDNAFLAIITEGDYDAKLIYIPNTDSYQISRIYSASIYRREISLMSSNASTVSAYEVNRLNYDRNIKYIFLKDEDADYSGMAKKYREYLNEKGLLNKTIKEGEKMPFAVDFLMGVKPWTDVLVRETIPMTTYAEAIEILNKFRNSGIDGKIYTNLIGWTKAGAYDVWPDPLKPSKALGGLEKLKELTQFAKENNIEMSLQFDPVRGDEDTIPRRDVTRHVVKNTVNVPITVYGWYLYSSGYIQKRFEEQQIKKLLSYGANSVGLSALGQFLYYDFNEDFGGNREDTANRFAEILKLANEMLGGNSIDVGNAYLLKYAGRINYVPIKDSGYYFTDETVPFFQMIIHGSIPYSGGPYNLLYDKEMQKLQFIENGCMPFFYLTQKSPTEMRLTNALQWEELYSSEVDHWFDEAVQVYKEFDEKFSNLWDETIEKHEIISKGVKKVTYSDGSIIYLNYNSEPAVAEGITIEPVSYVVKGGAIQ